MAALEQVTVVRGANRSLTVPAGSTPAHVRRTAGVGHNALVLIGGEVATDDRVVRPTDKEIEVLEPVPRFG